MTNKPALFLALTLVAIFATTAFASHNTPSNTTRDGNTTTIPPGGPNPQIGQSARYDICKPNPSDCQAPPPGAKLAPGVSSPPEDVGPENLCWYKGVWYLSNNSRGSRTWWYYFAEELNQYCCLDPKGEREQPRKRRSVWSKDRCKTA